MYDSASKKLKLALKQATRYSFLNIILELLELERKLICYYQSDDFLCHSQKNYELKQKCLKQLKSESDITFICDQLFIASKNGTKQFQVQTKAMLDSHKEYKYENLSFDGKCKWLTAFSFYYRSKGDFKKAELYHNEQIKLWHSNPHRMAIDSKLYKRILSNYASDIFRAQPDLFFEVLQQLKDSQDNSNKAEAAEDFQNIYLLEFRYFLNRGEFGRCNNLIPEIEVGLKRHAKYMQLNRLTTFYYNILVFYFVQDDYHRAKVWLEKIFTIKEPFYHFAIAKIIEAIISLETSLNEITEHIFYNNFRLLKKKGFNDYYIHILQSIKKVALSRYDKDELNLHIQRLSNHKDFVGKEELLLWFRSKLTGKNMREIFMEAKVSEAVEAPIS